MFRMIALIKRKPGMTLEEFKTYYEERHIKLAQQLAKGATTRLHVRTYLTPMSGAEGEEPPFDCIAEICYEDEAHFQSYLAALRADTERLATLSADEAHFVDRAKTWTFTAERYEATLP